MKVRVLRDGKPKDFVVHRAAHGVCRSFDAAYRRLPPLPPTPPHEPGMDEFDAARAVHPRRSAATSRTWSSRALTPQLGSYFGTSEGVLVVRAPEEEGLKLQDGDVILSIDGRKPTSGSHATRILRSYQPGEKLTMQGDAAEEGASIST